MLDFLWFCLLLAVCISIGGFVLNLLFILVMIIGAGIWAGVEWFINLFKGGKQ